MRFTEDYIQEVLQRNQLQDIASRYTNLKRNGDSLKGLCPFHGEKTPSFTISENKQLYYCFGCGAGGTVINFIMQIENLDFKQAIEYLANRASINIPAESEEENKKLQLRNTIFEMNKIAGLFYHETLIQSITKDGILKRYLKERGLSLTIIRRFGIGYADNTDLIIKKLSKNGIYSKHLLKSGIAVKNSKGALVPRFRNRLIFPIINEQSQVIGFGGRVLDDTLPNKYLNSPETEVFKKNKNLFGLLFAKKTKLDNFMLVEGYMDVVTLHKFGVTEAIANLGTAFNEYQAKLLKKYNRSVVIAYDNDTAGRVATKRAAGILIENDIDVKILVQNRAKDPDEYLKKFGVDEFRVLIDTALPYMDFIFKELSRKYDINSSNGKYSYINDAVAEIAKFNNVVQREVYISKLADITLISRKSLENELDKCTVLSTNNIIGQATPKRIVQYVPRNIYTHDRKDDKNNHEAKITEYTVSSNQLTKNIIKAECIIIKVMLRHPQMQKQVTSQISVSDFLSSTNQEIFSDLTNGLDIEYAHQSLNTIKYRFGEHLDSILEGFSEQDLEPKLQHSIKIVKKYSRMRMVDTIVRDNNINLIERLTKIDSIVRPKINYSGGGTI